MSAGESILLSINISKGGIPKRPVPSLMVNKTGLEGDGHNHDKHYRPAQAVCLQDMEALEDLKAKGYPLEPGTAGENLTVRGLHVNSLPIGTILKFSGGVQLELTRERPTCYVMDQIDPKLKEDADGCHGMYAKVLKEGRLTEGETIHPQKRPATECHGPFVRNAKISKPKYRGYGSSCGR